MSYSQGEVGLWPATWSKKVTCDAKNWGSKTDSQGCVQSPHLNLVL